MIFFKPNMKSILKNVLLILMISIASAKSVSAQELEGIAIYKLQKNINIKLKDSTEKGRATHKQIVDMMKKYSIQEYTLEFNNSKSIYKKSEILKVQKPNNSVSVGGVTFGGNIEIGTGNSQIIYKNITQNNYIKKSDILGKEFLIKDKIEKRDWLLVDDTKNIEEFACKKATTKVINPKTGIETMVTAWYTLAIPVQNGPSNFDGLPGLIMQIYSDDKSINIICTKVDLNPKKRIKLKEPRGGKIVTQSEFNTIYNKKMDEMKSNGTKLKNGVRVYTSN